MKPISGRGQDCSMVWQPAERGYPRVMNKMNPWITALLCAMLAFASSAEAAEAAHTAPNCTLTALGDGQGYDLQRFRGRVLYVDFWASWCGPCGQSFPFMNQLHHELADSGLQVVAVNLDEQPEDAKDFLARHPAHFAVATDASGSCPRDFGVQAMPTSYLIDRRGVIRHVHLGFRPGETGEVRALLRQLLAESPAGH
jgi:thiol-disulfide isomerase/thioredoxin